MCFSYIIIANNKLRPINIANLRRVTIVWGVVLFMQKRNIVSRGPASEV